MNANITERSKYNYTIKGGSNSGEVVRVSRWLPVYSTITLRWVVGGSLATFDFVVKPDLILEPTQ